MDQETQPKWEWTVSAPLESATADQIWPFLVDFFNIANWFPTLPSSYGIHGNNGEVGCIRYGSGFSIPSLDGTMSWSKERLTAIDPVKRLITYEIVDCNIGFKSYVSTVQICPGSRDDGDGGCLMRWSVTVDPIGGRKLEEVVGAYEDLLKVMAKNMEDDALGRDKLETKA